MSLSPISRSVPCVTMPTPGVSVYWSTSDLPSSIRFLDSMVHDHEELEAALTDIDIVDIRETEWLSSSSETSMQNSFAL